MKELSPELNGIEVMHPELGNIKVIIINVFKEKMEFVEKPFPELDGIEKMRPELGSIKEGTGTLPPTRTASRTYASCRATSKRSR